MRAPDDPAVFDNLAEVIDVPGGTIAQPGSRPSLIEIGLIEECRELG